MKILFLGTGAADWPLKPEEKMEEGDRRYCSMLIDGKILLDVAPQSYAFAKRLGIDLSHLTDCFISHTHSDHYNKKALLSFAKECGGLRLHLHRDAVPRLGFSEEEKRLFEILPMGVFDDARAGGYFVTACSANHLVEYSAEQPLHFIFETEDEKKRYLLGGDGGLFTARTWEYMRTLQFDGIVFDATVGDSEDDFRLGTHNSIPMLRLATAAMRRGQMLSEGAHLIASHLARTLHAPKEETERLFSALGITVAYDGLEIEM